MSTFGEVLEALPKGMRASLPEWRHDMYLKMNESIPGVITHEFIAVHSSAGITPWGVTQHSILSKKWRITSDE